MDLNRVATFVRVVSEGSFTAAAKALSVPKSSVSRSVSQLEDELGVRLLHRTTRKLALTAAGSAYYERVARALGDIGEATSAAADTQAALRGTVRITAPGDFGAQVLAPMISRFVRRHPGIHVDLLLTGRLVDLVGEGVDFAVRAGALRDSSLIVRRIGVLESALYATPKYVATHGMPETVEDLARHDVVLFRANAGRSVYELVDGAGQTRTVEVTGPVGADDLTFVDQAVRAHAGIGLLPRFLCVKAEERGRLVRILPGWAMRGAVLHVVYPSARFVPERVKVLREYVLARLARLSGLG